MKATKQTTTIYTITLDEQEAMILKGIVQNPISDDESADIGDFRLKVWNALTGNGDG